MGLDRCECVCSNAGTRCPQTSLQGTKHFSLPNCYDCLWVGLGEGKAKGKIFRFCEEQNRLSTKWKRKSQPKGGIAMWMVASGNSINMFCRDVEVYTYMQVSHPCTCVWRSEVNIGCLLPSLSTFPKYLFYFILCV